MATLAQTTQTTRTVLKWLGVLFAAFLIIRLILFPAASAVFNALFPKKPPPPTVAFGKLPAIPFPSEAKPSSLTFTIQTTTGTLPTDIPDRLNVYPVTERQAGFSSYDLAKQKVSAVGFTGEGTALSSILYTWRHPKVEGRQITFNIVTQTFSLTSNIAEGQPLTSTEAILAAKNFLSSMSLLPADIDERKTRITFLKLQNGRLTKTTSLSQSNMVQVDLYRKSLSDLPILYPNPQRSLMSFRTKKDPERSQQIAEASFTHKPIDDTRPSTYPVKTPAQAFDALQQGQAYIASGENSKGSIAIHKVYVAYYEGSDDVQFLLPIFVFEGNNNFQAFVSAITEEWQEQK